MRSTRGFTLIEVMITVAIVAILASIAIPSYSAYITRSKIAEATTALLSQRTKMEQFFQDQRTYAGACLPNTVAPLPAGLKYFTIDCGVPTATTYTITATGGTAGDGSMTGFTFSINEGNTRTTVAVPAGWTLPAGNCWVTKTSGTC